MEYTVEERGERYLEDISRYLRKSSVSRIRSIFRNHIVPSLGEKLVSSIGRKDIERMRDEAMERGLAPSSVQQLVVVLHGFFRHLVDRGVLDSNPAARIKTGRVNNARIRYLTKDEAELLLSALKEKSRVVYGMTLTSLFSGLRQGEDFNLTWADIDFKEETIFVSDGKGGKSRTVPMHPRLVNFLPKLRDRLGGGLVFPTRDLTVRSRMSRVFLNTVNELGFNTGVTDPRRRVVFHTLRHTYASWLVQAGVDLYVVRDLLGHSRIKMTERYSHLAPERLKGAVDML